MINAPQAVKDALTSGNFTYANLITINLGDAYGTGVDNILYHTDYHTSITLGDNTYTPDHNIVEIDGISRKGSTGSDKLELSFSVTDPDVIAAIKTQRYINKASSINRCIMQDGNVLEGFLIPVRTAWGLSHSFSGGADDRVVTLVIDSVLGALTSDNGWYAIDSSHRQRYPNDLIMRHSPTVFTDDQKDKYTANFNGTIDQEIKPPALPKIYGYKNAELVPILLLKHRKSHTFYRHYFTTFIYAISIGECEFVDVTNIRLDDDSSNIRVVTDTSRDVGGWSCRVRTPTDASTSSLLDEENNGDLSFWFEGMDLAEKNRLVGMRGEGLTLLFVKNRNRDDWLTTPPKITVPVRGAKVYDPRLGAISAATTVFSRNPALQYADYLRSVEYGAGQRNIPVTNANIIELANHFDQIPDSIGNAGINSILIDVQIDTGKPIVDNMNVWMEGTRLYTSDYYGQFNVRVETKSASVWTFNEHDLEGETQYDSGDFTERLNSLTYTVKQLVQDQSEGSQVGLGFGDGFDFYDDFNLQYGDLVEVDVEATFPESGSAIHTAWLAEDGGIPNFSSESLEYVSELDQALYWTMVDARISRQPRTMELPVGAIGWLFETGDVIQHTSEIMAETNSYWRVSEVSEGDGETVLNCVAYDDAFYVPDPDVVPTPVAFAKPPIILTIPTITGFELYQENGDFYLQWDELEDSRVLWYAVEIYDTEGVLVQSNQRVSQSPLLITNPSIQSYTANIVPYGINLEGEITQLTLNIVAPVTPTSAPSVTSKAGFITVSPPALASNKFTYEWEWSTNEDATIVAGGTTIAKTISGVIPDVEYVIGYRAVTSNGVGDWLYVNVNGVEKTTYIWYVYADNNVGAGISLDPSDKTYFGILGNRPVPTPDISDPTIFDYYIQPVSGVTIGDGITAGLSSDSRTISTNSAGEGGDYSDVSSKLTILVGKVDDTSSYTLSTSTSSGVFGSLSGSTFTVTDLTADSGTVTFTATRTDYPTLTKVFSLSKAKDGVTGADGASVAYLQQFETSASQAELVVHNGTKVLSTDNFSGTYAYYLTGAVGNVANSVGNGTSFYLTIPEDLALSFVGNTVVFSIYAKAPTTNPSAEFAIAYSTNEVGNSGFTNHTPTSDWNKYSLEYIVPEPATGGADYIIIVADTSSSGKSLLIDSVRVEIKGVDGLSAFEIWSAANGNQNEAAFLESLNVTDGDDGNTWYSETGDSANWVIGVVGDFILSDGSNVYKKTDVSPHTWAFVKNLIGETGETGPDGVTADAIVGIEGQRWGFGNNTLQDFITVGCSGVVVQKGVIKLTTTNTDPNLTSPSGLTIKGNESYAIRVRIRTTSVTHTTSFEIYYSNDDHSFTGANYLSTPVTYVQNEWKYLVFDMRDVGDWYDPQTINRLRFDFSQLSGKNYEIDGIVVGFFGSADETNYDDARIGNNKISIDDLVAADFSRPFTRKPNQWEEVADATEGRFSYKVDGGTTVVNNVFSSAERTKLNRLRSGQNPSDASKSILNDGIIANDLIGSGKTFTVRPNSTLPSNISTFGKIRFNIDGVDADYEAVSTSEVDTRANGRIGALRPDSAYKNTNTTKANVGLSAVDNKSALTLKSEAIAAAKLESELSNGSIIESDLIGSGKTFTVRPNKWEEATDTTEGRFSYKLDDGTTVVNNVFSSAERTKLNRLRSGQNPSDASKSILNDGIIESDLIGSGKTWNTKPASGATETGQTSLILDPTFEKGYVSFSGVDPDFYIDDNGGENGGAAIVCAGATRSSSTYAFIRNADGGLHKVSGKQGDTFIVRARIKATSGMDGFGVTLRGSTLAGNYVEYRSAIIHSDVVQNGTWQTVEKTITLQDELTENADFYIWVSNDAITGVLTIDTLESWKVPAGVDNTVASATSQAQANEARDAATISFVNIINAGYSDFESHPLGNSGYFSLSGTAQSANVVTTDPKSGEKCLEVFNKESSNGGTNGAGVYFRGSIIGNQAISLLPNRRLLATYWIKPVGFANPSVNTYLVDVSNNQYASPYSTYTAADGEWVQAGQIIDLTAQDFKTAAFRLYVSNIPPGAYVYFDNICLFDITNADYITTANYPKEFAKSPDLPVWDLLKQRPTDIELLNTNTTKADVGLSAVDNKSALTLKSEAIAAAKLESELSNGSIIESNLIGSGKTFAVRPNKWEEATDTTEGRFSYKLDDGTTVVNNVFSSAERTKLQQLRLGKTPDGAYGISNNDAAIDATAKVAVVSGRVTGYQDADSINTNPLFDNWSGAQPDGWVNWSTSNTVKDTSNTRSSANSVRFSETGSVDSGISFDQYGVENYEYLEVQMEVMLLSGDFKGSGLLIDWQPQTSYRRDIDLHDIIPAPTLNVWHSVKVIAKRPANAISGTFRYRIYLMGNYNGLSGGKSNKTIIFNSLSIKPASEAAILAYNSGSVASGLAIEAIGALRPDSAYKNTNTTKANVGLSAVDNKSALTLKSEAIAAAKLESELSNGSIIESNLIGSGKTFAVRPNSTLPSNISTFGKIRFNIDGVDADYEAVSTSEVDTRANGRIGALRPDSAYKNTNTTKANVGLSAVDNKSALTLKSEAIAAAKLDSLLVNNSGAGFNFFNGKYQNPDLRIITYSKANIGGTLVSGSNFNQPSGGTVYVIQATNSDAYVYLGTNSSDYNTPILPNRKWLVSMWVYTQTASSTNKTVQMYMRFSNGAHIGMTSTTSTTVNQWKRVSGIIDATGNASDSCVVRIDNDGGSGTTVVYDQIMIELYVEGTVEPSQYSPPINEYKIKDQRTIPMVNSAGASAAMNINPLSAADVGSYTTITIAAHTVQMASGLVSYNSGSISYKPFATAYYIYCDDYDVIGGAVTYIATTTVQNLTADSARRYIGRIVTPSDGGGTTIPPDFECLDENMWLTPTLQIKDACVGDVIDVFDTGYTSLVAGAIQALKKGEEDCVQIITESDCEVICTIETPITRVDGSNFLAHNALGEYVYVNDEGVQRWEQVTKVTSVGSRKIVKISVGNISFSAGTYAHKQIVTHNQLKP
jgi:hypothetical protein